MKRNELFKRKKTAGPRITAPALTVDQAMANRALYEQEIGPMGEAATIYFQRFMVNNKERCWLLPRVETWRDLNDEQVNYVVTYLPYFTKEIEKVHERQNDQIPFNYGT